ncbi:MAG: hypothetical protein L0Y61_03085 [Epsilonproteobacteria bacterium]|nr:hypothetical protein [Campylobacterota bacterium]
MKKVFYLLLFCPFLLFSQTIEEQLEAIQESSGKQRVELVNKLKLQIAELNEAQREEAIYLLQKNKMRNSQQKENHKMQQHGQSHTRPSQSIQNSGQNGDRNRR